MEVIYRFLIDGNEVKNVFTIILHGHFLEIAVSRISRSEASFLFFLFFIKSVMKLVDEPPLTVDLSLIVAAVPDADACSFV